MIKLSAIVVPIIFLAGCTSAELNSWGIPAVVSKDSDELSELEVFQEEDRSPLKAAGLFDELSSESRAVLETLSPESKAILEELADNIKTWDCSGDFYSNSLQDLGLASGSVDGEQIGFVVFDDLEIITSFSIDGLERRWDWEDYSIVLSPDRVARYYDFSDAEEDPETKLRSAFSSQRWDCQKRE